LAYGKRAVFFNVDENPEKRQEMLCLTGGMEQVPVIVDDGKVTIGFLGEVSLRGAVPLFGGT
jgi:glutaredoxin